VRVRVRLGSGSVLAVVSVMCVYCVQAVIESTVHHLYQILVVNGAEAPVWNPTMVDCRVSSHGLTIPDEHVLCVCVFCDW
jgi:hypothetical protein